MYKYTYVQEYEEKYFYQNLVTFHKKKISEHLS